MRLELRMKYLETIHPRYRQTSKQSKGKISDKLHHVCGYNRFPLVSRLYSLWLHVIINYNVTSISFRTQGGHDES
jgi:hypothetical protein